MPPALLKTTLILLLLSITSCSVTNNQYAGSQGGNFSSLPPNPDPKKCYVRTVTPNVYATEVISYYTYSETEIEHYPTEIVEVVVKPEISRWEYTTYDDCQSANPNDCQVLCYRTYEAEVVSIQQAMDTSLGNPELVTLNVEYLQQRGGQAFWEEIECELTTFNKLPIDFEVNSSRLSQLSHDVIDQRLLALLHDRPNIRIEIQAHTSSRGNAADNQSLSQKRGQTVVNYLVGKGINRSRLVAGGFGESQLKNRCADGVPCSEAEHQENERVEFRVMNADL